MGGLSSGSNLSNSKSLKLEDYIQTSYSVLGLEKKGLDYTFFKKAVISFYNLKSRNNINKDILTVVDFEKPSSEKRLYVVDLKNQKLLFHTYVAHGKNTGGNFAMNFSNVPESNKSSLGFYITKNTYSGKHGLSLIISGLDKGFNSNAEARSIVVHGAKYVSEDFINCNGRLGRSQGCPALPMGEHEKIISTIASGSVMFIYHPKYKFDPNYLDSEKAKVEFEKIF